MGFVRNVGHKIMKKKQKDSSGVDGSDQSTPPTLKIPSSDTLPSKEETKEIKVIERIIESKEVAPADVFGKLSRNQINLIKQTVAKGASDEELQLFLQVCKGANLNPFMRQVHLVPRWDSKANAEVRTIQVGIDGFRAVAESSGAYAGNEDPIFDGEDTINYSTKAKAKNELKVPQQATVTVYKIVQGGRYPFTATARWSEYYPGEKMGFQWHVRPKLMLGKCAEALALRKAFPKLLSGMYAAEELDRTASVEVEAKNVKTAFQKLMDMLDKMTVAEMKEYKEKMEKSDKYTEDQKAEFCIAVDDKIKSLEKEN